MSIYLSASSIKDFIQCPQKVLYRFGKKVKEIPSRGMIIGKIVHSAIEEGWKDRDTGFEVAYREFQRNDLEKSDYAIIRDYVESFYNNFQSLLTKKDKVEYNFKLKLYEDVFLVGKMDRISNGIVYDWKTGKVSNKLSGDIQCIIYEYAYREIFGEPAKEIYLASLSQGSLIRYVRNDLCVEEVMDRIIPRMIKTVKNEAYERTGMFNHACFMCPYKVGCLSKGAEEYVVDNTVSPEQW